MKRPLGRLQIELLHSLKEHGSWSNYRSGWVWNTDRGTQRILETLVARGRVVVTETEIEGSSNRKERIYTLKPEISIPDRRPLLRRARTRRTP